MDWDPYPGSALPTDVSLGKATSFNTVILSGKRR